MQILTTLNSQLGVHEIWVKEEDIDYLYAALALATLRSFCGQWNYEKQRSLFGAFLFHKDPKLFIELDFAGNKHAAATQLKALKAGKEFLEFLESFGVLSFSKGQEYKNGKWVDRGDRSFFSTAELDLVKRQRKDIVTCFEYKEERK